MEAQFHPASQLCPILSRAFGRGGIVAALVCLGFLVPAQAAEKRASNAVASADFFADPAVRRFKIEIAETNLASLRRAPRTYVRGNLMEGGTVLTNVGIHLKGMGSFRTIDERPSLAVKFDEFVSDQEYRGLTKLMFNNSVQDPTYVAELLAAGLFRDAGVPAPQVTYARVELNGRDLGLYVIIEAMNKRFLRHHFKNAKGNLYEGYLLDINVPLDQDNGEVTNQADRLALLAASTFGNPAERYQQLGKILDVDRFISFVAMEMLVGHWDGYAIHTNNYRIYHDPDSDKMVFITHGLDWAFRRPNISIQPPMKSIVGRAVLETKEGQQLYQERVATLFTNVFKLAVITNRMEQALARLRSAELKPAEVLNIEKNALIMRDRIVLRATRVAEQLAGRLPPPLAFGPDATARLTGWRDENDRGEPVMDQPTVEGKRTLHVQAQGGRSRASWRTQVYLTRGRYRFEGLVRTGNVTGGGAGLRISGGRSNTRIGSSTGWRSLSHEFEVQDAGTDIEFVCEFYAVEGEVWFDLDTLRVRRL
jgi:spore coat protein H